MTEPAYDVCVIGSGPAGGVLSKELAEAGAKVVVVEAGRAIKPSEFHYHAWPYDFPARVKPTPGYLPEVRQSIRFEDSDHIFVDRIRAVGGRSIHWNACCFRFAERDFRERSLEGIEDDWPLTYKELAPFYSYVERMIGVTGSRENLEILPDGEFLPPLKFRCSENTVKNACKKLGIAMIPTRKALNTVPYDGRPACHYCGHCMEACDVGAIFTVPDSMLPKARKTGNFTLLQNRIGRELLLDGNGRIRAISTVDTVTRAQGEVRARVFAVCCGAIESPRLLLNSRSSRYPNGVANSNDVVGRYLHGHINAGFLAYLEGLVGSRPVNNDGAMDHSYIPRFNLDGKKREYAGGFQYQLQDYGFMFPEHARHLKGFGAGFKQQVRFLQPGFLGMDCFGKVLANPRNRVTVDRASTDVYGIPIPVIRFRFSENDVALWRDMKTHAQELLHTAKSRLIVDTNKEPDGFASHEVGTVRMGTDPRTSVLNGHCQSHEIPNLFVVDGSCFPTFPEKNPTLTIMALAVRAARYIRESGRKGEL
jgi:choline dehydrogenase-like flavoprotein